MLKLQALSKSALKSVIEVVKQCSLIFGSAYFKKMGENLPCSCPSASTGIPCQPWVYQSQISGAASVVLPFYPVLPTEVFNFVYPRFYLYEATH
jgi:hypothetical protein